jgi:hypothetical protein
LRLCPSRIRFSAFGPVAWSAGSVKLAGGMPEHPLLAALAFLTALPFGWPVGLG